MSEKADDTKKQRYAGFWRRFLAIIIDYIIVSIFVFPFVLLVGIYAPDQIVVSTPFNLFTTERTIDTQKIEQENSDSSTTAIEIKLVETTCLGKWNYLYKEKTEYNAGESDTSRQLIDPETNEELKVTTADDIVMWVIFIYWILMESSKCQSTFGKMALGIYVTDCKGNRLSIVRALGRNFLKIISCFTMMIGFMMAGWTTKKQALHDKISNCLVVIRK